MAKRRSVRKYEEGAVTEEEIRQMLTAALLAPTSRNLRPWEFVVVRSRDVIRKLSAAKASGAAFAARADVVFAVLADSEVSDVWIEDCSIAMEHIHLMAAELGLGSCWIQMRRRLDREGKDAEANVRQILSEAMRAEKSTAPDGERESGSGFDPAEPRWRLAGLVAVGRTAEMPAPRSPENLDFGKVHYLG